MEALVSIIIPAYNADRFINETISSVIKQTYTNWELIIVNDGSTDNTLNIVENYCKADHRISIISKRNTGVSDSRNIGITHSKGQLIAFLDADDMWMPHNLEKKIDVLKQNPDVDFVFSNNLESDQFLQNQKAAPKGKDSNIFEDLLLWNGEVIPGPCSNMVVWRKCFDSGIRFDTNLTTIADQNFTVQISEKFKGKLIDEPLWIYRVIPGSMSKSTTLMEQDALATYNIYKKNNYFKSTFFRKKCFSNMYLIVSGSWFKDGKNFAKGLKYLLLGVIENPFTSIPTLFKKILKKRV